MKSRTFIFSSILCLCGTGPVVASECVGGGCYNISMVNAPVAEQPMVLSMGPAYSAPESMRAQMPNYIYPEPEPETAQVKLLSIKSVPADSREPVWDGTVGNYDPRGYDKTVDWRDGVPIWDDSVSSYKYKDYTDWFLQPMPELYIRESDGPTQPVATVVADNPMNPDEISIVDLYRQNMADAAATRARVEELLRPKKPTENLWVNDTTVAQDVVVQDTVSTDNVATDATVVDDTTIVADETSVDVPVVADTPSVVESAVAVSPAATLIAQNANRGPITTTTHTVYNATIDRVPDNRFGFPAMRPEYVAQDLSHLVSVTFGRADGCPFDSDTECEIWRRKPIIRETVSPRSPRIREDKMAEFISAARVNKNIMANEPVAAPLLERYKMLMNSAQACCTDGMAYNLKQAGASDGLIYKFLADDANFYQFGARCLMTTDAELDAKYPNTATAAVVADVRNGCLCRGRQWFQAMLAPFQQAYQDFPEFADYKFNYTYTDGLQREITVSVNNDVQNVLNQLALCP